MLRAYIVGDRGYECVSVLVFANSQKEARKTGCRLVEYDEYIHLPVERLEDADGFPREGAIGPYVENDDATLRKAGYSGERSESDC